LNPKAEKILDKIHSEGIDEVLPYFNDDFRTLLKYLDWGNALEYLQLDDYEYNNDYYNYLLENGYEEKVLNTIISSMGSVSHDGTDYFYEVRDLDDLSKFFRDSGRDISPQEIAKSVLNGDFWEPFSFYRNDIDLMRNVYDELNEENKQLLRSVIVEKYGEVLIGIPSEDVTDVIERIGTEDDNGDYEFHITNENVMDLFSDDDTMNYLFKNYLDDIESELFSLYSNSYNTAYQDEYYDKVWDELNGTFLDVDAEPIEFKYGNSYRTKLKITNTLPRLIKRYLNEDYCSDIDSLGDYWYLVKEGIGCSAFDALWFRISDYADSWRVKKIMNDSFRDYF
jgi:hypothetical protein